MIRFTLAVFLFAIISLTSQASCISLSENYPIESKRTANEWLQLGVTSFYKGKFDRAIKQLKFAIKADPDLYVAYDFLAASYIGNQNNYSAICTYMYMLHKNPNNAEAYVGMARAKINIGDLTNAKKDLIQAETLDPDLPIIYEIRGNVALNEKNTKEALKNFKLATVKDSTNIDYFLDVASLLFHSEDYAAANPYFDKARSLGELNLQALINAGSTKQIVGQLDQAEKLFNQAVGYFPAVSDSYFFRGAFFYNTQQFTKAILDFEKAIKIEPKKSIYFYNRAMSYSALDSLTLALNDLSKAIEIESERADYYLERAKIHVALSNVDAALKDYSTLIDLHPNNPAYYLLRGKLLLQLNRKQDACEDLAVATEGGIEEARFLQEKNCAKLVTSPSSQSDQSQSK